MREIQIQFSKPGNWREFTLTAIYQDSDGYTRINRYKQNDIPSGQAPALSAAVAVIADMEEDWQAVQVWARLGNTSVLNNSAGDDEAVEFCLHIVFQVFYHQKIIRISANKIVGLTA